MSRKEYEEFMEREWTEAKKKYLRLLDKHKELKQLKDDRRIEDAEDILEEINRGRQNHE